MALDDVRLFRNKLVELVLLFFRLFFHSDADIGCDLKSQLSLI